MLALTERPYLHKIYTNKYLQWENQKYAEWLAYKDLQQADYLLNMDEDKLYWDSEYPYYNTHADVLEDFDESIRGTGQGIELEEIFTSKEFKYIGDVMNKMPLDVMIYKGKTGIGGTTLAIEDNRKWIICVGSRRIVKSKSEKHENTLGVFAIGHGGATNDEISNYRGNTVFTTWSSLERVMENIDVEQWSLLLDEPQELIGDGGFRPKDINNALKLKNRFKHCTTISATETKKKDYLKSFDDLDILRIRWEEKRYHDIEVDETKNLITNLAQRSLSVLEDDDLPNLHIFINSVDSIIRITTILEKVLNKDLSDKISIVVAEKASNVERIEGIGNGKYSIEDLKSVKRINFYTSTCFSGVDIEDNNGDIVIAADGRNAYTRLHLIFDIIQIPGRIRNPRDDIRIHLVFVKGSSKNSVSRKEYNKSLIDYYRDADITRNYYNKLSNIGRGLSKHKSLIDGGKGLNLVNGRATISKAFFMNKQASYFKDNILYTELLPSNKSFKIVQGDETFRFSKSDDRLYISEEIADACENTIIKRGLSFKKGLEDLIDVMDKDSWEKSWWQSDGGINVQEINEWLEEYKTLHSSFFERYPIIQEAFLHYSPNELKEIGFKKIDIKIALGIKQGSHEIVLLKNILDLKVGVNYKSSDMKQMINKSFQKIGVKKSVTATYIKKIYSGIQKKKIRVDEKVVISEVEYRKIKSKNYGRSKTEEIPLSTLLDENGDVVEFYKTVRNGGRQEVYILPV